MRDFFPLFGLSLLAAVVGASCIGAVAALAYTLHAAVPALVAAI